MPTDTYNDVNCVTQTLSDQAEIWYSWIWDLTDLCKAFETELRIALGHPGAEISTIENSTYFFHFLTREKFAIFAVLLFSTFNNVFFLLLISYDDWLLTNFFLLGSMLCGLASASCNIISTEGWQWLQAMSILVAMFDGDCMAGNGSTSSGC